MASVENHPKLGIAQYGVGGGGHRLPESAMRFNWREDSRILSFREYTRRRIAEFLSLNTTGDFQQVIAQLSAEFESRLFTASATKEDYLIEENLFANLKYLIHEKFLSNMPAQQEAHYGVPSAFPTFTAAPSLEQNAITNSANAHPGEIMGNSTPFNLATNNNFCNPLLSSELLMPSLAGTKPTDFTLGRKRTHQMTSSLPDQCVSDMSFVEEGGMHNVQCVDSNLTFSGSVLQYESEASFDSSCKAPNFIHGELDPVTSTEKNSSCVHISSTSGGDSKLKGVNDLDAVRNMVSNSGSEAVRMRPGQQLERYEYDPTLRFNGPSGGKGHNSPRFAQSNNGFAVEPGVFKSSTLPVTEMCGQLSVGDDIRNILFSYVKYKSDPKTSSRGQALFLRYVHRKKCSSACACETTKLLLDHFDHCGSPLCRICGTALNGREDSQKAEKLNARPYHDQTPVGNIPLNSSPSVVSEDSPSPSKFRKLNSFSSKGSPSSLSHLTGTEVSPKLQQCSAPSLSSISGNAKLNLDTDAHTPNSVSIDEPKSDLLEGEQRFSFEDASPMSEESVDCKQNVLEPASTTGVKDKILECFSSPSKCVTAVSDNQCISKVGAAGAGTDTEGTKLDTNTETCMLGTCSRAEKLKMQGVSLTEFFTPEEIRQHMRSLKQKFDQTSVEQEIGNTMNHCISDNFCQLCNLDKLWFPPMPIYCLLCAGRIKYKGTYYSMLDENGGQFCYCSACYNKSRGANKSKMEMRKNDVVTEESWVQCDKCEGWQHQICALFNDKRDFGGKAEYICPKCCLAELEAGERNPIPWSTCFDASNLPRTILSDHLEQRLFERLDKEREDRLNVTGKDQHEVPGASDLTVRVVSSVDKILKVKQQFLDIFPDKAYPEEFPYRSKVILLFQKIEGVDVCLFGMYVQEFGSQCSHPNQRCIYISYLDSVKYFRPEIKSVAGEALRTFVYQEILIGYLEYCKKRGFSTCYIWACPPVKGEDYILYCHPEAQKTPKPDKLRQWYQSMLRKASKEKIVVNFTNIYEKFFVPTDGCNTKVTAARLPYFDGDYWSSVADSMIKKIEQECGGDLQKKVKKITRRSLKAMGHTNPTDDDAKDILLMQELGQAFSSAKDDFIIVYLQHICTQCHEVIKSGKRWHCSQCKNFQLCESCHDESKNLDHTHISGSGQKHALSEEEVNDVPADTEDSDAIMNNCFLENRHALLSFCQGNHYQFDTLRRAKHSSMMILYHLHNPIGSLAATTCSLCLKDVAIDRQWKCEICPDFIVCPACYQRNGVGCHTHNLTQNPRAANQMADPKKTKMVEELLEVLLHASKCRSTATDPCGYPNCVPMRKLFAHSRTCNIRVHGGCLHCKKTWQVLILHSQKCQEPNCYVPRCRDLKGAGKGRHLHNEARPPDTTTPEDKQLVRVSK